MKLISSLTIALLMSSTTLNATDESLSISRTVYNEICTHQNTKWRKSYCSLIKVDDKKSSLISSTLSFDDKQIQLAIVTASLGTTKSHDLEMDRIISKCNNEKENGVFLYETKFIEELDEMYLFNSMVRKGYRYPTIELSNEDLSLKPLDAYTNSLQNDYKSNEFGLMVWLSTDQKKQVVKAACIK